MKPDELRQVLSKLEPDAKERSQMLSEIRRKGRRSILFRWEVVLAAALFLLVIRVSLPLQDKAVEQASLDFSARMMEDQKVYDAEANKEETAILSLPVFRRGKGEEATEGMRSFWQSEMTSFLKDLELRVGISLPGEPPDPLSIDVQGDRYHLSFDGVRCKLELEPLQERSLSEWQNLLGLENWENISSSPEERKLIPPEASPRERVIWSLTNHLTLSFYERGTLVLERVFPWYWIEERETALRSEEEALRSLEKEGISDRRVGQVVGWELCYLPESMECWKPYYLFTISLEGENKIYSIPAIPDN